MLEKLPREAGDAPGLSQFRGIWTMPLIIHFDFWAAQKCCGSCIVGNFQQNWSVLDRKKYFQTSVLFFLLNVVWIQIL